MGTQIGDPLAAWEILWMETSFCIYGIPAEGRSSSKKGDFSTWGGEFMGAFYFCNVIFF